jgi:hypothetical protein
MLRAMHLMHVSGSFIAVFYVRHHAHVHPNCDAALHLGAYCVTIIYLMQSRWHWPQFRIDRRLAAHDSSGHADMCPALCLKAESRGQDLSPALTQINMHSER